jgi:pyruvate/2-oxoglutarate/acetoin dehydrogenase E1 component
MAQVFIGPKIMPAEHTEISIDILDLRTLLPLDYFSIREAVQANRKGIDPS